MAINDPIGDLITRIRNGASAKLAFVDAPHSRAKLDILSVLKAEGFISSYETQEIRKGVSNIRVDLKYSRDGSSVIKEITRISKPGRKVYSQLEDLVKNKFRNGLGVKVLSTSQGIMTDKMAFVKKIGGEVLFSVF